MIVTVTANPSFDRTLRIDRLERGGVMRGEVLHNQAGGKGVNVSVALDRAGVATRALVIADPAELDGFRRHLDRPIGMEAVPTAGAIRTNLSVVEADGTTTKLNEPGPTAGPETAAALVSAVRSAASAGATWIVLAGSLPPGLDPAVLAEVIADARDAGASVAADVSGRSLEVAVGAGVDLVKPNLGELATLAGHDLTDLAAVEQACLRLLDGGVGSVLCSLGADGAFLCGSDGVSAGEAPTSEVRNTVGAGDSMLAGYLAAEHGGADRLDRLRTGLAWGRAAVRSSGTGGVPDDDDLAAATVTTSPDRTRRVEIHR